MELNSIILGNSPNLENIQLNINNKEKENEEINKSKILCDYYYNLHLESYLFLNILNKYYLSLFIIATFVSGFIDLLNYKDSISKYLYLACGIINIFTSIFFNTYKNLKLAETLQEHYDYSNKFKILKKKINTQKIIYDGNQDYCIYRNIFLFIKQINDEIDTLLLTSPIFPTKILNKYHIKDKTLDIKSYNLFSFNNTFCFKCHKINIKVHRKDSIIHMSNLKESDINNYENFINEINKKNKRINKRNSVFNI
jgi:hypothetical protein